MATSVDFQLPENLTITNVHGLHEELEDLVDGDEHDNIVMQAENVSRADTAGIQLLLAFVNTANERQIKLSWNKPSEKLVNAVATLGLEDALGIH